MRGCPGLARATASAKLACASRSLAWRGCSATSPTASYPTYTVTGACKPPMEVGDVSIGDASMTVVSRCASPTAPVASVPGASTANSARFQRPITSESRPWVCSSRATWDVGAADEDRCTSGSARPTAQLAAEFHEAITIVQAADDEDDVRSGTPRHLECLCSGGVHGAVASGLEHTPHRVGGPAFVADNERHPSEQ